MKTNFLKVVAITIVFALSSLSGFSQENQEVKKTNSKEVKTVCFKTNLHCNSCVNNVKENIPYEKGVKDLNVDLDANTITIEYKTDKTTEEELAKAIIDLGYEAKKTEPIETTPENKE